MNKLQVCIDGQWKYVFCRLAGKAHPVTTDDKNKALPGGAIDYFQRYYGNHQFRISK